MKTKKADRLKAEIPEDLLKRIEKVENNFSGRPKDKIAAFDLDNTLLQEDVGEAVFFQLQIDEKKAPLTVDQSLMPFTWAEYQALLAENKKMEAYTKAVTAMAGIAVETVTGTTRRVMSSEARFLQMGDYRVPLPSPSPLMQALVHYLKTLAYDVYVISASNHFSVRYVAEEFFGIPESHVFGMKPRVTEVTSTVTGKKTTVLSDELEEPVTVGEGKADVYRKFAGPVPPAVTAGDSTTDIPVLDLTDPGGLIIWVGKDREKLKIVGQRVKHPENIYFLKRTAAVEIP